MKSRKMKTSSILLLSVGAAILVLGTILAVGLFNNRESIRESLQNRTSVFVQAWQNHEWARDDYMGRGRPGSAYRPAAMNGMHGFGGLPLLSLGAGAIFGLVYLRRRRLSARELKE